MKATKEGFKSTTLPKWLWDWLNRYKENKRLRSISQAIEWLILEAGYDLANPSLAKSEPSSAGEKILEAKAK